MRYPKMIFILLGMMTLQSCAVLRWVGLASDGETEMDDRAQLVKLSKEMDSVLTSNRVDVLEKNVASNAVRYENGIVIQSRNSIVQSTRRTINTLSKDKRPECCTYPQPPTVKIHDSLAILHYVVKMKWPNENSFVPYSGYITRIFEKPDDRWLMIHSQENWFPENQEF